MVRRFDDRAKACPFCGSKAISITPKEMYDMLELNGLPVNCNDCGCELWWHDTTKRTPYEEACEYALEKWNRRYSADDSTGSAAPSGGQ